MIDHGQYGGRPPSRRVVSRPRQRVPGPMVGRQFLDRPSADVVCFCPTRGSMVSVEELDRSVLALRGDPSAALRSCDRDALPPPSDTPPGAGHISGGRGRGADSGVPSVPRLAKPVTTSSGAPRVLLRPTLASRSTSLNGGLASRPSSPQGRRSGRPPSAGSAGDYGQFDTADLPRDHDRFTASGGVTSGRTDYVTSTTVALAAPLWIRSMACWASALET